MTKPAGGLRNRRRPDVMELLALARPASLDPGQDPQRQAEIARLAAAEIAAAGTAPTAPTRAALEPAPPRPARRLPRAAVLAGTGLTAAAAVVAVAVLVASADGTRTAPGSRTRGPVLLTATMVDQVASASRSALARSGRATVSITGTLNGVPGDASTDVITFSGKNWNDVTSQTSPASDGRPAHTQTAINRIVNGQFYLYTVGRNLRLEWIHDTNRSGHPRVNIPDPRTVLRALEPSARFEVAGYQVIGGVRVKELRATDLSHLPDQSKLVGVFAAGGHVTSLEVWVDGRGVVHRLSLTSEQVSKVYPPGADNVRVGRHGPLIYTVPNKAMAAQLRAKLHRAHGAPPAIIRIARPGFGPPRRVAEASRLTVTFSAIGQPQRITAPAHAIPVYGRG
jgi:hypothetical protein